MKAAPIPPAKLLSLSPLIRLSLMSMNPASQRAVALADGAALAAPAEKTLSAADAARSRMASRVAPFPNRRTANRTALRRNCRMVSREALRRNVRTANGRRFLPGVRAINRTVCLPRRMTLLSPLLKRQSNPAMPPDRQLQSSPSGLIPKGLVFLPGIVLC